MINSGGFAGVFATGAFSISNYGTIAGGPEAVLLGAGATGVVSNASSGLIQGRNDYGVAALGSGTVDNDGQIVAPTQAVDLTDGGLVSNTGRAIINGFSPAWASISQGWRHGHQFRRYRGSHHRRGPPIRVQRPSGVDDQRALQQRPGRWRQRDRRGPAAHLDHRPSGRQADPERSPTWVCPSSISAVWRSTRGTPGWSAATPPESRAAKCSAISRPATRCRSAGSPTSGSPGSPNGTLTLTGSENLSVVFSAPEFTVFHVAATPPRPPRPTSRSGNLLRRGNAYPHPGGRSADRGPV